MDSFSMAEATIIQSLKELEFQVGELTQQLGDLSHLSNIRDEFTDLRECVEAITKQKDFYSTREVAELMGVTRHTVQVRWCAEGKIECEKDATTGRWRIPGDEYDRLRRGGSVGSDC